MIAATTSRPVVSLSIVMTAFLVHMNLQAGRRRVASHVAPDLGSTEERVRVKPKDDEWVN
jgi:hypothetical protein